jgi:hypothetical protein
MKKVYALNTKGELTLCSVPPEDRGKGRCDHVIHQREGQSVEDFIKEISSRIAINDNTVDRVQDQTNNIISLVQDSNLDIVKNPNWENVIKNKIPNYFNIGKGDTYEQAELQSVEQEEYQDKLGDKMIKLTGHYKFNGKVYDVNLGSVPKVQEDGTIQINGSKFRVLPVISRYKDGIIQFKRKLNESEKIQLNDIENQVNENEGQEDYSDDNDYNEINLNSGKQFEKVMVVKQSNGHVCFSVVEGSQYAKIAGKMVPLSDIQAYLNHEKDLSPEIAIRLDNIDSSVYKRFPDFNNNLQNMVNNIKPDEPNDLSYRHVYTYEDQVRFQMNSQMRRMGTTFRTNLAKIRKAKASGQDIDESKYPLFYQKNMTENILTDLVNRSNVQVADNLNPIAANSQATKLCLCGKGGFKKDRCSDELRMPSEFYEDKIDCMDLSSGKNIGLTVNLSHAKINNDGYIVHDDSSCNISTSDFIPYKYHTNPNRAIMACSQLRQACPVIGGEDPRPLGDASDKAWSKISGSKLGCNLRVAYLPHEYTWEDSVLMSESAAKKFMTRQTTSYIAKGKSNVKEGQTVKRGQIINGVTIKYDGIVKKITNKGFDVDTWYKFENGDKISGRYGNKGVVSKILPDKDMPEIFINGKYQKAEVLMSPLGVASRSNYGCVLEVNNGDPNKKTLVKLKSGHIVEATAGYQYIMRLNQIAEKKLSSFSDNKDSNKEYNGLRMGEMESLLLTGNENKLKILNYIRNQESSDANKKLQSALHSIGVSAKITR